MSRRNSWHGFGRVLAAAVLGLGVSSGSALALDDLKVIAPANPGGGWDQTARSIQQVLQSGAIVKTVTVENIPGAGGTIGLAQFVDKQAGNGNALLVNGLVMVGAILTNNAAVTLKQTTPIARLTGEYEVIVVPANSEFATLAGLIEKLKADPGAVAWGGGSAGGTDHILAGLVAKVVGVDPAQLNYVPFSGGGEALAAVLGGHVTAGVSGYGEWEGQIASGELRALAISSAERLPGIDIPTLREQGIDVDLANWRAIVAPPGIDDAQKTALLDTVDAMVKSEGWQTVLKERNWLDLYLAGDEFAAFLADEDARITATLQQIGLVK
jgi:putative tricarboxylic transport membrane protein